MFPEEGWAIDPVPPIQLKTAEGQFTIASQFRGNRLFATVYGPDVGAAWLDIRNGVRRAAMVITDALGFTNAAAPTLIPESYRLPGETFEKFNTAFDGLYDHDGNFHAELFIALVIASWNGKPEGQAVAEALSEVRIAILEPEKTAVHSYRAVEAIRQTFVEQADNGSDRNDSWKKLRGAVSVPCSELDWLSDKATPVRHGEVKPITFRERQRAISIARKVIRDYVGA